MLDPITTGYLAGLATSVTATILNVLGRRVRQAVATPPRQQALERCYHATLAALLPEDDPHREALQPLLEEFVHEPAVTAELAKLVRGHAPDQAILSEHFAELAEGRDLPPFDVATRLAAGIEAFLQVAEQEPDLAVTLQTAQLRDATQSLWAMAGDVRAIRQAVAVARSQTGAATAGRDMTADNIVTGTQILHIVNVYQAAGGAWGEADYRAALGRYLAWLAAATGRVVLRGIQRGGQQAVELSLHEVCT